MTARPLSSFTVLDFNDAQLDGRACAICRVVFQHDMDAEPLSFGAPHVYRQCVDAVSCLRRFIPRYRAVLESSGLLISPGKGHDVNSG